MLPRRHALAAAFRRRYRASPLRDDDGGGGGSGDDGGGEELDLDEDVVAEARRVERLDAEGVAGAAVVLRKLRHVYPPRGSAGRKVAVDGFDLAIGREGCFGLLGANGAGRARRWGC